MEIAIYPPNLNCRCETLAYLTERTVEDVQRVSGTSHWFCEGEACERDCHCPKRIGGDTVAIAPVAKTGKARSS